MRNSWISTFPADNNNSWIDFHGNKSAKHVVTLHHVGWGSASKGNWVSDTIWWPSSLSSAEQIIITLAYNSLHFPDWKLTVIKFIPAHFLGLSPWHIRRSLGILWASHGIGLDHTFLGHCSAFESRARSLAGGWMFTTLICRNINVLLPLDVRTRKWMKQFHFPCWSFACLLAVVSMHGWGHRAATDIHATISEWMTAFAGDLVGRSDTHSLCPISLYVVFWVWLLWPIKHVHIDIRMAERRRRSGRKAKVSTWPWLWAMDGLKAIKLI